ncbi:MAG: hypothetical protein AABX70_09030 [Nanoarchaeota archaeon]
MISDPLSLDDYVESDTAVSAAALERAVPYASSSSFIDLGYAAGNGTSSYRASPLHSRAHESLYANHSSAPYRGSDFQGNFDATYGGADHARAVYASAKQANPYQ